MLPVHLPVMDRRCRSCRYLWSHCACPHGTKTWYNRHLLLGEPPCDLCRDAGRAAQHPAACVGCGRPMGSIDPVPRCHDCRAADRVKICEGCGGEFDARPDQRSCSPSCVRRPRWSERPRPHEPGYTAAAGYGSSHQRLRAEWAPLVEAGGVECAAPVCVMPERLIGAGQAWDLGHLPDRSGYRGPEHERCNRVEAGVRSGEIRRARGEVPADRCAGAG
jgi:hypothetical protein